MSNPIRLAFLGLFFIAGACATPRTLAVGEPLAVDLVALEGGKDVAESLRGRVVLVEVWASWCRPCSDSLPFLQELGKELGPRGLSVVGINTDEDPAAAERFLSRHGLAIPTVRDPGARLVSERFAVRKLPTLLLVDRDGIIRYTHEGFLPRDGVQVRRAVESLLDAS